GMFGPGCCSARHFKTQVADRKSTRLNSSHSQISYAVFCLKKKTSELQSQSNLVCRLLLEKKKRTKTNTQTAARTETQTTTHRATARYCQSRLAALIRHTQ